MVHILILSVGYSGTVWEGAEEIKITHEMTSGTYAALPPDKEFGAGCHCGIYQILSQNHFARLTLSKIFGVIIISDLGGGTLSRLWPQIRNQKLPQILPQRHSLRS